MRRAHFCRLTIPLLSCLFFQAATFAVRAGDSPAVEWTETAAQALPATVNISISKVSLKDTDSGADSKTTPGERSEFVGSGFIVDPTGIVVTNKHVIDGALHISVTLQDGTETSAEVLGGSAFVDLALLKIDVGHLLPTLKLGDSAAVRPGDAVLAIGDPLGVGTSLSAGIVSGTQRDLMNSPYDDYIQTDAAINHGNSGGPLVNSSGEVIGVDSIVYTDQENEGSIGLGFAISSNVLAIVMEHLLDPSARLGWIGVHLQGVTPDLSRALAAPNYGSIVTEVEAKSTADIAGLKAGDIILSLDNKIPANARALMTLLAVSPIGLTRTLKVWSAGNTHDVEVTVGAWDGATGIAAINLQDPRCLPPPDPSLGLLLEPISPFERQLYELGDVSGLVVVAINPMSEAYGRGFRPGIVVQKINDQPVTTPEAANALLEKATKSSSLVALLVSSPKGPSWFTLHTGYDEVRSATDTAASDSAALCQATASSTSGENAAASVHETSRNTRH